MVVVDSGRVCHDVRPSVGEEEVGDAKVDVAQQDVRHHPAPLAPSQRLLHGVAEVEGAGDLAESLELGGGTVVNEL